MFLGWDWGFQVEDDLKTSIFWGFLLKSALKVNRLALRESVSCCDDDGNSDYDDDCG